MRIEEFAIYNTVFFACVYLAVKTRKWHRALVFIVIALLFLMSDGYILDTVLDTSGNLTIMRELANTTEYVNGSNTTILYNYKEIQLQHNNLVYFYMIWFVVLLYELWAKFPWNRGVET